MNRLTSCSRRICTLAPARLDFQAVLAAGVRIERAVCVSRDRAGELTVEENDHLARQDAELPGGVCLAIGRFASWRLRAMGAGAAVGRGLGQFADQDFSRRVGEHFAPHLVCRGGDVLEEALVASAWAPTRTRAQQEKARRRNWLGATPQVQEWSDDV